jgi:UDP-N-acetylmuramyl tripeptide synthase
MTGVTGTNGKTSVAQWLAAAWTGLGRRTATIGTVGNGFMDARAWTPRSTPPTPPPMPVTLQGLLAHYRDAGAAGVAMEVSSHGLDQGRVEAWPSTWRCSPTCPATTSTTTATWPPTPPPRPACSAGRA